MSPQQATTRQGSLIFATAAYRGELSADIPPNPETISHGSRHSATAAGNAPRQLYFSSGSRHRPTAAYRGIWQPTIRQIPGQWPTAGDIPLRQATFSQGSRQSPKAADNPPRQLNFSHGSRHFLTAAYRGALSASVAQIPRRNPTAASFSVRQGVEEEGRGRARKRACRSTPWREELRGLGRGGGMG